MSIDNFVASLGLVYNSELHSHKHIGTLVQQHYNETAQEEADRYNSTVLQGNLLTEMLGSPSLGSTGLLTESTAMPVNQGLMFVARVCGIV